MKAITFAAVAALALTGATAASANGYYDPYAPSWGGGSYAPAPSWGGSYVPSYTPAPSHPTPGITYDPYAPSYTPAPSWGGSYAPSYAPTPSYPAPGISYDPYAPVTHY